MKLDATPVHDPHEIRIHAEAFQRKEAVHIKTVLLGDGHKPWELDMKTLEIRQAVLKATTVKLTGQETGTRAALEQKDMCVYVTALNKRNAAKVFMREFKELGFDIDLSRYLKKKK